MKKSLSPNQKNRLLPLAIPLVALVMILIHPADPRDNASEKMLDTATRHFIPSNSTDPQLFGYKKISDSLEQITRWKKERLKAKGNGLYVLFAGVTRVEECDTCIAIDEKNKRSKHFISFNGFALQNNSSFRIEGNNYFIDPSAAATTTTSGENDHLNQKEIDVRLSAATPGAKGLTLLLPVTPSFYRGIKLVMNIFFVLALLIGVYLFVMLPVQVLLNIAKGKAFVEQNVRKLNWIGWGVIGTCLSMIIFPKLLQFILGSRLPAEIYFPFWSSFFDYRWSFFIGIAILLLARAFKQGYQLQQWEDLTI